MPTAAEVRREHRDDLTDKGLIPGNKRDALQIMSGVLVRHLGDTSVDDLVGENLHALTTAERGRLEWALEKLSGRISGPASRGGDGE